MSSEIHLESWEEFIEKVGKAQNERDEQAAVAQPIRISPLLFRGHRNASWTLETTLERQLYPGGLDQNSLAECSYRFLKYYEKAFAAQTQIETMTGRQWDTPEHEEIENWSANADALSTKRNVQAYEYLAYLRHHGFPSPLLDWSVSPYIAAFFAFRNKSEEDRIAIYSYQETPEGFKNSSPSMPTILVQGPYVRSHPRHFHQQSSYTICAIYELGRWVFTPHEQVFSHQDRRQDKLIKYTIPAKERAKVLKFLDNLNINAYSLFQSEDALMSTLSYRLFDKQK